MIVVPVIALRGGGPRVAVDVSAAGRVDAPVPAPSPRRAGGVTLETATVAAVGEAGSDAPDVSVAAAAEVAPSPVKTLLATVRPSRDAPLGSTSSVVVRESAEVTADPKPHRSITTTPATVPPQTATGDASWYQAAPGTCAHPTLPFGTVVTILDVANGRTATCTVDDRGPYQGGRIIDLSYDVFAKLAAPGLGVIDVRLSW